ncbi:MAG: hypothetical protein V3U54_04870 [Thermodesulfobacteriota bacterium]
MKKKKIGKCVFCGKEGKVTNDHIPPRNIFPKPQDDDVKLITVPACTVCNSESSKLDDESFKVYIGLVAKEGNNAENKLYGSMMQTIQKNSKIKKDLIKNAFRLPSQQKIFTSVDESAIKRVLKKIVLGLYYEHFNGIIFDKVEVDTYFSEDISEDKLDEVVNHVEEIRDNGSSNSVGKLKEFYYIYAQANDNKLATCWILIFYNCFSVIAQTIPH